MKAAPRKKQAAVDAGQPVGIPEGHSFLNTAALELKTKASPAEYQSTQMLVGPSARVVEPRADDLLRYAPEGCFAAHTLSVEMGLRFPLHPFLLEYLRFVGLAPCQLTPNNHSYVAGFLSLCQSRGVEPTLDQFFMSFNLCRGDIQMLRALPTFSRYQSSGFLMMCPRLTRGGRRGSATSASRRTPSRPSSVIASGAIRRWGAQLWRRTAKCLPRSRRGLTSTSRSEKSPSRRICLAWASGSSGQGALRMRDILPSIGSSKALEVITELFTDALIVLSYSPLFL
ncbi:unnamed protein product [Cuscuta europaea]|uniref:Transposase (putative) gypsy type domain-containing protein n=1 Tax=Cuscuta europaea TaxID=41803 RepID=A0A9P0ZZ74_CUSEU|nr:unnamed protein product [Cuscuta europaea]